MEVWSLVGKITLDGIAKVETQLNSLEGKLKKNEAALKAIGKGMVAVGGAITGIATLATKAAVNIESTRGAFENLAMSNKQSADKILSSLKKTSAGTISEYDLMLSANRAMVLGVTSNTEDFSALMNIARDRARAMGLTTTQAFDDIITGIGRGSPLILDNLGLVINQTEVNKEYAKQLGKTAEELTENEKKQALLNAVLKQGADSLDSDALATKTVSESLATLKSSLTDLMAQLGEHLLPILQSITDGISSVADKFERWAGDNPELARTLTIVATALGGVLLVVGFLTIALPKLAAAVATVKAVMAVATGPIGLIITGISLLTVAITALIANWGKVKDFFGNLFGKAKDEAIETANVIKQRTEELTRQLKAELDKQLEDKLNSLEQERNAALKLKDDTIAALKEEYGIEERTAKTRVELAREASNNKLALLDKEIQKANDTYNQTIKSLNNEMAAYRQAYNERIRLIDEEYAHQIQIIDATLARKTGQWNNEIDALYEQLDAEAKARKEEERNKRIAELKAAVESAQTEEQKAVAIADLNEYLAQVEYERWQESIRGQIKTLQEKIQNEQEAAAEEKRILDEAREAEIAAEEARLADEEARINAQIDNAETTLQITLANIEQIKQAEEKALQYELLRLEAELNAKIATEEAKYKALEDSLDKQAQAIKNWHAMMISEEKLYQSALAIAQGEVQSGKITTGARQWEGYDPNKYDAFWNQEEGYHYIRRFASGGLISTPSLLTNLKTGQPYGVMAESGPEAIVPFSSAFGGLAPAGITINNNIPSVTINSQYDIDRLMRDIGRVTVNSLKRGGING